jgi:hypothetical protein
MSGATVLVGAAVSSAHNLGIVGIALVGPVTLLATQRSRTAQTEFFRHEASSERVYSCPSRLNTHCQSFGRQWVKKYSLWATLLLEMRSGCFTGPRTSSDDMISSTSLWARSWDGTALCQRFLSSSKRSSHSPKPTILPFKLSTYAGVSNEEIRASAHATGTMVPNEEDRS